MMKFLALQILKQFCATPLCNYCLTCHRTEEQNMLLEI